MRTFYYSLSLLILMIGLNISSAYARDCTMVFPDDHGKNVPCTKDSDCYAAGTFCNTNNQCPDPQNVCWYSEPDASLKNKSTKNKSTKGQ